MHRYSIHSHLFLPHHEIDGISSLFLNIFFRNLAVSSLGIFVPLYALKLFTQNYHFGPFYLVVLVGTFFILREVLTLVFIFPGSLVVTKLGFRKSIAISNLFLILFLLFLVLAEKNIIFLWLAPLLNAALIPLYWLPYHLLFVKDGHKRKLGREVGISGIIGRVTGALSPLLGGLLIFYFGFNALFLFSIFLIVLSSIPPFFMRHHKNHQYQPPEKILPEMFTKRKRLTWAFLGMGGEDAILTIFWPIFVFWVINDYEKTGFAFSAALFLTLAIFFLVGNIFDKKEKKLTLRFGAFSTAFVWPFKAVVLSLPQIIGVEFFYRLTRAFLWVPFDSTVYLLGKKHEPFSFIVYREIAIHLGRFFALWLVCLLFLFKPSWVLVFLIASTCSSLASLITSTSDNTLEGDPENILSVSADSTKASVEALVEETPQR